MHCMTVKHLFAAMACCVASLPATAQDYAISKEDINIGKQEYSPYLHQSYPNRVFWGDTHLHTSYSTDAGLVGNTVGPEEALRFARGEKVISSTGIPARLIRPLDFLVVADHAENLGLAPMIEESDPLLLKDPVGRKYHDLVKSGKGWDAYQIWKKSGAELKDSMPNPELARTAWERIIDAVDKYNQPGVFTAFHGFEWTSTPDLRNMHRNVIFRDGAEEARQVIPLSFFDTQDPEKLWDYMQAYEDKTGGRALAIPHGGNLSQGLMFAVETMSGKSLDKAYAERRMHWEPIYEVTQIKGDGEAHPSLSPNDEFADYYQWDKGDFGLNPKKPEMLPHEYARSALKIGLEQEKKFGANPFKFGIVGSSDSHTSLASTREECLGDDGRGAIEPLDPPIPVRGRVGGVEMEHQMMPEFVSDGHQGGRSTQPDRTMRFLHSEKRQFCELALHYVAIHLIDNPITTEDALAKWKAVYQRCQDTLAKVSLIPYEQEKSEALEKYPDLKDLDACHTAINEYNKLYDVLVEQEKQGIKLSAKGLEGFLSSRLKALAAQAFLPGADQVEHRKKRQEQREYFLAELNVNQARKKKLRLWFIPDLTWLGEVVGLI